MVRVSGGRSGATLPELLVALTLLALIGSAATASLRMQTGARERVAGAVAGSRQAREAMAPLARDLAVLSTANGDLLPGGATDSTLDLRAATLIGFTCAAARAGDGHLVVREVVERGSGPIAGDSLRVYRGTTPWPAMQVTGVGGSEACALTGEGSGAGRLTLDEGLALDLAAGTPVRVTRAIRYSLYHAGSGAVNLGLREWSYAQGRLATVQPIAGPFAEGESRFTYVGRSGERLAPPVSVELVAAIGIRLVAAGQAGLARSRDSLLVAIRNR